MKGNYLLMSGKKNTAEKPSIEIQIPTEVSETKSISRPTGELTNSGVVEDVPTISTLLQRKKLTVSQAKDLPVAPPELPSRSLNMTVKAPVTASKSSPGVSKPHKEMPVQPISHRAESSPIFKKKLVLDALDLKTLKRFLKRDKKNDALKKLHVFGFFSTLFSEIAYFDLDATSQEFFGVMGYGSPLLAADARALKFDISNAPSIFGIVANGKPFCGNPNALRSEDVMLLKTFGFHSAQSLALFPVMKKRLFGKVKVQGVILATSGSSIDIDAKEMKQIALALQNLDLLP